MKKFKIFIFLLIFLIFTKLVNAYPLLPLHTEGTLIKDANNSIVILRGMNISNESKAPPFLPKITDEDLIKLRKMGINSVRFLVIWEAIEPEKGKFNEEYIKQVGEKIKLFKKYNIMVILDFHQDLFSRMFGGDGAPKWAVVDNPDIKNITDSVWYLNYLNKDVIDSFDKFWNDDELQNHYLQSMFFLIKEFKNDKNIIGIDLINEPYMGSASNAFFEKKILPKFYKKLILEIQKIAPEKLIFYEPSSFCNGGLPSAMPKLNFKNLVYAPHFYDRTVDVDGIYNGEKDKLLKEIAFFVYDSRKFNIPLWIGEWGITKGTAHDDWFIGDILEIYSSNLINSSYWCYDTLKYSSRKDEIANYLQKIYLQLIPDKIKFISGKKDKINFKVEEINKIPVEIVIPQIISAKIKITPDDATYKINNFKYTKILEILFKQKGDYEVSFK